MASLNWQGRSRVVAYLDLIIECLALMSGVVLLSFIAAGHLRARVLNDDAQMIAKPNCMVLTLVSMTLVAVSWQLYAAVQLLYGTEFDVDKNTALNNSRFWRNCNIIFIIAIAVTDFILLGLLAMTLDVMLRFSMMFIVAQYIRELETIPNPKHFVLPHFTV